MSHRYSRNPDHIRNRQVPCPSNEAVNKHLQTLLSPLVYSQQAYYRSLGMRDRIWHYPDGRGPRHFIMAAGPSVRELTRMLEREDLLWAKQLRSVNNLWVNVFWPFPYELFERIFEALLPQLKSRHEERKRPIAPSIQYGLKHFERIWAGRLVLEALFLKLRVSEICHLAHWREKSALWLNWPRLHPSRFGLRRMLRPTTVAFRWFTILCPA
jgi:hypothetical protein